MKVILGAVLIAIVLGVVAALVLNAKEFITFDARQGALAKQARLTVKP